MDNNQEHREDNNDNNNNDYDSNNNENSKKETNNWLFLEMIPLGKRGETIKYSSSKMKLNI